MRRRSFGYGGGFRTPRPKKIRPAVRVKERIAKKGGRCSGCRQRYEVGAEITVVNIRRRVFHRQGCVPVNVDQMGVPGAASVVPPTPEAVVKALQATWSLGQARLVALMAVENALVCLAKIGGVTDAMEKSFDRYNKIKERARSAH